MTIPQDSFHCDDDTHCTWKLTPCSDRSTPWAGWFIFCATPFLDFLQFHTKVDDSTENPTLCTLFRESLEQRLFYGTFLTLHQMQENGFKIRTGSANKPLKKGSSHKNKSSWTWKQRWTPVWFLCEASLLRRSNADESSWFQAVQT